MQIIIFNSNKCFFKIILNRRLHFKFPKLITMTDEFKQNNTPVLHLIKVLPYSSTALQIRTMTMMMIKIFRRREFLIYNPGNIFICYAIHLSRNFHFRRIVLFDTRVFLLPLNVDVMSCKTVNDSFIR